MFLYQHNKSLILFIHQTPHPKKREYDIWVLKMEHYLSHTDYLIWKVTQKGNGHVSVTTNTNGIIKVLPPKTAEEVVARERDGFKMAGGHDFHKDKKFHKRTSRKLQFDTKDPVGFDKTKVECFNYHKMRHFARDCRAKGNQDNIRRDVGYNGNKTRDNGSDNEVKSCSKACEESYARLKNLYDDQIDKHGDASVEITAYTLALKRFADGMHVVPPPMTGNYMPSGPDVEIDYFKFSYGPKQTSTDELDSKPREYASCKSDSSVETSTSMPELVKNASKVVCEPKVWTDDPVIEEYESDSDNDSVSNVQEDKEKPSFAFIDLVKHVKTSRENIKETCTTNYSPKIEKHDRNGHTKKGLGYAFTRKACFVYGSFSHLIRDCDFHEKRMAKQAELTKSKNKDDPHRALKDKGIVDSRCSRHMKGNKAHLTDYQEFKGGYIAIGGSNRRITSKGKIKTDRKESNTSPLIRPRKVLVTKPQNKTPYELLTSKQPIISYLRPFGCHVTILNTIDQLGMFDGKSDLGFLVRYSLNSKDFRVYNLKTKRVEENLHVNFLENKPDVAGKGHAWMFDLDYLNNSINYEPVLVENQANKSAGPKEANNIAGTEANDDQGANLEEIDLNEEHFVLPIWSSYSTTIKSLRDKIGKNTGFKSCEKPNASTSSTNLINTASIPLSTAYPSRAFNDGELSYPDPSMYALLDDPSMPHLKDIYSSPSEGIFTNSSYDDEGVVTNFNNLETTISVNDSI
nr:ribonuclease H-like domain-containing protein [Tanacetum cinerariifolium]